MAREGDSAEAELWQVVLLETIKGSLSPTPMTLLWRKTLVFPVPFLPEKEEEAALG